MKRLFLAIAVLLTLVACNQNKPSQAVENEKETVAQIEAADSINPQIRHQRQGAFLLIQ